MAVEKLLVRRPALAETISQSERKISELQKARAIPFIRIGRSVLFNPLDVVAALRKVGPRPRHRRTQKKNATAHSRQSGGSIVTAKLSNTLCRLRSLSELTPDELAQAIAGHGSSASGNRPFPEILLPQYSTAQVGS